MYICIDGIRITLVKTSYFPNEFWPWSFSRDMRNLGFTSTERHFTTGVSFLDHMEKRKVMVMNGKSA